jgi:putative ABC transport system substrate-binding protein
MAIDIQRREFIALLGGAAAWSLTARTQQRERMRRIGVLMNLPSDDAEGQARLAAFLQGLQEAGWAVGRNVRIDLRWGGGDADHFRKQAAELVALAPDVLFASGIPAAAPLLQATRIMPVVFAQVVDPVGAGRSQVWRIPAATQPVLPVPTMDSPGNGWSCSKKSHRA